MPARRDRGVDQTLPRPASQRVGGHTKAEHWISTGYSDGNVVAVCPSSEGETEQEALDRCRKEIREFFAAGCEPVKSGLPEADEVAGIKAQLEAIGRRLDALEAVTPAWPYWLSLCCAVNVAAVVSFCWLVIGVGH